MHEPTRKPGFTVIVNQGHSLPDREREEFVAQLGRPHMSGHPREWLVGKYPSEELPLDEAMKLFPGHTVESLAEKGITQERLQRIAFHALYLAHYQHYRNTPVAVDSVQVLTERFATNLLESALKRQEAKASHS